MTAPVGVTCRHDLALNALEALYVDDAQGLAAMFSDWVERDQVSPTLDDPAALARVASLLR